MHVKQKVCRHTSSSHLSTEEMESRHIAHSTVSFVGDTASRWPAKNLLVPGYRGSPPSSSASLTRLAMSSTASGVVISDHRLWVEIPDRGVAVKNRDLPTGETGICTANSQASSSFSK